ncbi:PfkB family carbohydrate kinase [Rhodosalinus sediminis]|uniref:PfkB family carbohydrate kinase n=1 Tax=Rhodosalinus sediminis TaxID=1940533 RepID=UPI002353936C|nr:PfkB family carbohydrate kinase [Rhodosalinus sediminis]
MTLWTLGSINADYAYRVPRLPGPGETVAAEGLTRGLGGKGANLSVAAARAAARVVHVGAVGPDGRWAVERLMEYGVDVRHVAEVGEVTGHAVIAVAPDGENSILIWPGANAAIPEAVRDAPLAEARVGDRAVAQNETNGQAGWLATAKRMGLSTAYVAAPFDPQAVGAVLDVLDLLILNAVEAEQLEAALGRRVGDLGVRDVLVTMGAEGCRWHGAEGERSFPAPKVEVVDTTGAGDTFAGYVLAGLDRGLPMAQAIGQAQVAAALMVARRGTADAIPDLKEVQDARLAP